jgi:hypothetical protein
MAEETFRSHKFSFEPVAEKAQDTLPCLRSDFRNSCGVIVYLPRLATEIGSATIAFAAPMPPVPGGRRGERFSPARPRIDSDAVPA